MHDFCKIFDVIIIVYYDLIHEIVFNIQLFYT